ncbi:MAG: peptidase U32 family protein [Thermodesulfobacteriota bacterium]
MHFKPKSGGNPVELLAPVGGVEAFFAAMDNGADAVYCGLNEFSARAKARNFSLRDLSPLVAYAHRQRRRLYVALNTLIKEEELPRLIDILAALTGMGVDGVILQDLGVWRLARKYFPELPLHASTQMTVHNAAGVKMLERMGFTRAVLARELSLAEIADIRRQTSIELEHFVHGALCFSISGQCLFSSWLAGQSGNRGRCAQPCRRRHQLGSRQGFYFSTSDFSAIELVPDLIQAGVYSLKIEGRMKSADYVARVVAAYRKVLDAPDGGRKQAVREAEELLGQTFARQATRGFLSGVLPAGIADPDRAGTLGKRLGEVVSVRAGMLGFVCSERLHVGDRVRVQPQNDLAGSGFVVRALQVNDRAAKAGGSGDFVRIPLPSGGGFVNKGDVVYKVGGKPAFTLSADACHARLSEQGSEKTEPACGNDLAQRRSAALAALAVPTNTGAGESPTSLTVAGRDIRDLHALRDPVVARLVLPLTAENLAGFAKAARGGADRRLCWDIPPILFGQEWEEYRRGVRMLARMGCRCFRVNNLGHLPLFDGLEGVELYGGFRCYTMNSQAASAWRELGLARLTLNLEDDRNNGEALARRDLGIPLELTVYGPVTVLLSRIPMRVPRASLLRTDSGAEVRMLSDRHITELVGEQDFSLLGQRRDFARWGLAGEVLELGHCGIGTRRGQEVLAAWREDQSLPGTVAFNFERGLS